MARPLGQNGLKHVMPPVAPALTLYLPDTVSSAEQERLAALSAPFGINLTFTEPNTPYFLAFDGEKILLRAQGVKEAVYADFVSGNLAFRTRRNRGELIARAVNLRENTEIWDATAGLGKDAFVLAALGAQVTLFERHPTPALLLSDALARAAADDTAAEVVANMRLFFGTIDNAPKHCTQPHAVYLDPMFPERQKSALVKKEMRFFHAVVGEDTDSTALLHTARRLALRRIVVKRPRHGAFVGDATPAYQYTGKSTRFDVYLPLS